MIITDHRLKYEKNEQALRKPFCDEMLPDRLSQTQGVQECLLAFWPPSYGQMMDLPFRKKVIDSLAAEVEKGEILSELQFDAETGRGSIRYNTEAVWIDPLAPGFSGGKTALTDEELVRAFLLVRLVRDLGYPLGERKIELERTYKSVGRPGKGGRVDILVRERDTKRGFLFIECKEPEKYDADLRIIDGQLFRLSRMEPDLPRNLVYYTVELNEGQLVERVLVIDPSVYSSFEDWDKAGQPIIDAIPANYGAAKKRLYANIDKDTEEHRGLTYTKTAQDFSRIRNEIHDVIWGGGGTNNNEVFVYIVKLILCKIYDEQETSPGNIYRFQRKGDAKAPETAKSVIIRMNALYAEAEAAYLALPEKSSGPAFDPVKVSSQKIAYVVGRLEGISVTRNTHHGDLLGEFFEQIVSSDFTQTKGQFFTPPKIVRFMLSLCDCGGYAEGTFLKTRDHLGRPRLPYVIDPSCGSGTFLIEYMKGVTSRLTRPSVTAALPRKLKETHGLYFGGDTKNAWAKEYLFGVENNYDLGLAAKVNMVLHGDGSMNTWIASGLLPFNRYWIDGRNNVLGASRTPEPAEGYASAVNEQFDFIISNPPFSLILSPDERVEVEAAFGESLKISEEIFIERWFQLLRPKGRFCCVLPESLLDTPNNRRARRFLIQHFKLIAIISLPYDAFKPFTSTKTCIIFAEKRSHADIAAFGQALARAESKEVSDEKKILETLTVLGWENESIFMAEPLQIGYKRRKNLPDLLRPNALYCEDENGFVKTINAEKPATVLDYFYARAAPDSPELGWRVSLGDICIRPAYRLDPKYIWLWLKQKGIVATEQGPFVKLGDMFEELNLTKVKKGDLEEERQLIDLDAVKSRMAEIADIIPVVDEIGSDKVIFGNANVLFSKLEPYLGKVLIDPPRTR